MPPTVALARPEEPFAAVNPFHVAARQPAFVPIDRTPGDVHPGVVFFGQDQTTLPVLTSPSITTFVFCSRLSC